MDDLISRQAVIETALTFFVEYYGAAFDEDMQRMLKDRLDSLPSAQPEIIHCRDCRHHGTAICRIWSRYGTINTPGYGFCYRAERKETDEID